MKNQNKPEKETKPEKEFKLKVTPRPEKDYTLATKEGVILLQAFHYDLES